MSSGSKQTFYGIMAIVGLCATWYFNIQAMQADPNFSFMTFLADNYVNPSSASITNDILVVLVVFFFWSFFEARKLNMKYWWVYLPLSIGIALAFALPLFMLMRERALAKVKSDPLDQLN